LILITFQLLKGRYTSLKTTKNKQINKTKGEEEEIILGKGSRFNEE
jgi:hypothetical protein